jgi:hypothetical protein
MAFYFARKYCLQAKYSAYVRVFDGDIMKKQND